LLLNYFPSLHRSLLQKFLIETYLYLDNPAFMKEVHERIARQLNGRKPCIVIAHSLGSVSAYNYLIHHPELNVQRFITLGSPLAFQVIQSHLPQPIVRPAAITGDWINFYSTDDFLPAFPLTQPPFQFQPAIINHGIRTHIHRPHDITGYLLHPQVVEAILELLKIRLKPCNFQVYPQDCFKFTHSIQKIIFFMEMRLTPPCFHPIIRPPLKRPYRLEA